MATSLPPAGDPPSHPPWMMTPPTLRVPPAPQEPPPPQEPPQGSLRPSRR
jgi:hypothetical protein